MTALRRDTVTGLLLTGLTIGLVLSLTKLYSTGEALEQLRFEVTPDAIFIVGAGLMLLSFLGIVIIHITGRNQR